ncbi:30S ribosomal protein S18 [Candidatus Nomurabacteria bacterium]|nr:30S ribosomal protein S18 [Candidatus Nomurabacteria bacterium]
MKQQCYFKQNGIKHIDYKNVELLRKFLTTSGKIMPAKRSGVSRKNQRALARAIKNARFMGLLPFIEA